MHFWLHHTAHCAEKIVSARLCSGSASGERVGQDEVGGINPQGDMHMHMVAAGWHAHGGCSEEVGHGWTLLIKMAEVTLIDFSYLNRL